jgi:hypothetical protein
LLIPGRAAKVFGLGIKPLQEALDHKADEVQREFIELGNRIDDLGKQILELRGEEQRQLREEQSALRTQQQQIAESVNLWRDRARKVLTRGGTVGLRSYLEELTELNEPSIQPAVDQVLRMLDMPPDELIAMEDETEVVEQTPAGRLLERARIDYDIRTGDAALRLREAITFANRPGIAQDDSQLEEIAAAMEDADPFVKEVAVLTTIQLHRFRALRMADLDVAHQSTQYLARLNHFSVISTLIEILETPRTGYLLQNGESVEADNDRSRMVALLRLVEWHTAEAQAAVKARQFDRDETIVKAATRALELFQEPWSGPLKGGVHKP